MICVYIYIYIYTTTTTNNNNNNMDLLRDALDVVLEAVVDGDIS